jgi:hypothetical protein
MTDAAVPQTRQTTTETVARHRRAATRRHLHTTGIEVLLHHRPTTEIEAARHLRPTTVTAVLPRHAPTIRHRHLVAPQRLGVRAAEVLPMTVEAAALTAVGVAEAHMEVVAAEAVLTLIDKTR